MPLVSVNPATGRVLARHPEHTAAQREEALSLAHAAFADWSLRPVAVRARCIAAVGAAVRRRLPALARIASSEMGKTLREARAELEKCAACCDFYAARSARMLRPEHPAGAPGRARVCPEPLGVILAIMPWNYPFWQAFRAAVPALMAGNTVLLKHASNVSGCALAIERLFSVDDAPAGLLRVLLAPSSRLPAMIRDPRVRGVTLTGSTAAGRRVAALAGAALKPCVLELGGSDPYVVLADADLDLAAEICAAARMVNAGQSCVAAKRFVVVEEVRAAFEQKLVARLAALRMGDPLSASTDYGPLARTDLRDELHAQVAASLKQGARLLLGGRLPRSRRAAFYPATVLSGVRPGMPAYDEELFGPVAAVVSARDEADALRIANDTPFGLGAAIFTRDLRRARTLARRIDAGMVFVNAQVRSDPALPFGGTKDSGIGRELARQGLHAFVNAKTVWPG